MKNQKIFVKWKFIVGSYVKYKRDSYASKVESLTLDVLTNNDSTFTLRPAYKLSGYDEPIPEVNIRGLSKREDKERLEANIARVLNNPENLPPSMP